MKIAIPTKMTNKESLYKLTNLKSVTMLGGFGKTDLKTFDFSNYRKLNKIQIVLHSFPNLIDFACQMYQIQLNIPL